MNTEWEVVRLNNIWTIRDKNDHKVEFNFVKEEIAREFKKLLDKAF